MGMQGLEKGPKRVRGGSDRSTSACNLCKRNLLKDKKSSEWVTLRTLDLMLIWPLRA